MINTTQYLAIHQDVQNHAGVDGIEGLNDCATQADPTIMLSHVCRNAGGLEDLFVSATANWFMKTLGISEFSHWIYAPNRVVEKRLGFDLSVGKVNTATMRLRIQTKMIKVACDEVDGSSLDAIRDPFAKHIEGVGGTNSDSASRLHLQCEQTVFGLCAQWWYRASVFADASLCMPSRIS